MNRRQFILGAAHLNFVDVPVQTMCSVCGKPAMTAEEADRYEERPSGTCCYKADEKELYIHPKDA